MTDQGIPETDDSRTEVDVTQQLKGPISPVTSMGNKISSSAASFSSKTIGQNTSSHNENSRIAYVNERRLNRDALARSNYNNRPRNIAKEAPDVKHMEKALLVLLNDFHTGKLTAFDQGCSMEQMISIRDQQENLSRMHFKMGGNAEIPDCHETANSRDKIKQLVHSLEQLSVSIENLHSSDTSSK